MKKFKSFTVNLNTLITKMSSFLLLEFIFDIPDRILIFLKFPKKTKSLFSTRKIFFLTFFLVIWLESNSQLESASIWLESKPKKLFFLLILVFYKCKWYKKEKKQIIFFIFFWLESESHLTRVKFSNSSWLGSKKIKNCFFISRKFFWLKIISKKIFIYSFIFC